MARTYARQISRCMPASGRLSGMQDALADKAVLVTGASRGIGAGIATRFAAEGARVAITARSLEPGSGGHLPGSLREVAAAIEADGGTAVPVACDLADASVDRADVIKAVEDAIGPLDVVVNNAAACYYLPFEKVSDKRLRVAFEVNVIAPFQFAQAAIEHLAERGGALLNITTTMAHPPSGPPFTKANASQRQATTYGVSKAALDRLTMALACEYEGRVAVNGLAPEAAVATEGATAMMELPEELCEPMETMVEAALALCDADRPTGRVATSLSLLRELARPVRTLDGREPFDASKWLARVSALPERREPPAR
jgi:NAD(P)-dependent dehydrogenase (short-subunit alcohol dehydrogenase family)